ncbi:hypothetical protein PpBr36_02493 [Pyricularia pennisetigena]|uniref:hypothetical protein n=1 Tax=Pyricularia pennisetigena TaxID=1578925 RepID=UPI00115403FC|nr:hypothetical protein PpBr36_02493 [Pyricularia pennisetigena]TLS31414.1 hypothetical protein PpBr36_02493 [Pyricularia pennisetigena]
MKPAHPGSPALGKLRQLIQPVWERWHCILRFVTGAPSATSDFRKRQWSERASPGSRRLARPKILARANPGRWAQYGVCRLSWRPVSFRGFALLLSFVVRNWRNCGALIYATG